MKKPLTLSLACGLIAALFMALYLNSLESTYKQGAQKVSVLTAKQYIDQGVMIDGSLVEEIIVPKDYLQPRAIQSMNDLKNNEGKNIFMTVIPIEKGEQILSTKLHLLGIDTGISAIIPPEKRAVTCVMDSEKISGIIKPGNRIDIIGVFDYEDSSSRIQEASATFLQNVLVLSVGKSSLGTLNPADQKTEKNGQGSGLGQFDGKIPVSLALSPHEAELFSLAAEKGTISFSLRPIGDDKIVNVPVSRIKDILSDIYSLGSSKNKDNNLQGDEYLKEMQKNQREAMELLKKYKKK